MEDIYKIMNEIDDDASLTKKSKKLSESSSRTHKHNSKMNESLKSRKTLYEEYSVKFGLFEKGEEKFADLDSAIKYINSQLNQYEHPHLVLYNDGKEMIWLTRYKDEDNNDLGFTVGRQNDKSVEFDKKKGGLFVKEVDIDDPMLRSVFCRIMQQMGYGNEWSYFGRNMKFAEVKGKPSYLDFENKVVYYNKDEQIQKSIEKIISEYRAKKNMIKEEANFLREADEEVPANDSEEQSSEDKQNSGTAAKAEDTVQQLKNADYEEFVRILNNDGKSKAFVDYLNAHYKMGDNTLGTVKKCSASEKTTTCGKLIPTQENISLKKSFDFLSEGGWSEKVINDPVNSFDTPTVTYAGKYIIDGHHRWSRIYALHGPQGELKILDFPEIPDVSWEDMLKAVQLAIRSVAPSLDLNNKVDNPNMLDDTSGKMATSAYMQAACEEVVNAMKAKGYGDSKEAQAKRVGANAAAMAKKGSVPGAEPREFMPQTDKIDGTGKKVETALKTKGVIDMTEELDDDVTSLREYYDEEAPLGRHELYPETRVKPMEDNVPQWVKDKYGSNARRAWNNMRASDREFNKPYRP